MKKCFTESITGQNFHFSQQCNLPFCFHFVSDFSRPDSHSDLMSRTWHVMWSTDRHVTFIFSTRYTDLKQPFLWKIKCVWENVVRASCISALKFSRKSETVFISALTLPSAGHRLLLHHMWWTVTRSALKKNIQSATTKMRQKKKACQEMLFFLTSWHHTYRNNNMTLIFNFKYWYLFIFDW